jgi:hypothetical protein
VFIIQVEKPLHICYDRIHRINIKGYDMPQLQRIESQIAALPESELRQFRSWFDEFDADRWDHSLAADIADGKLDTLAKEALAHYGAGKCKPL